MLDKGICKTCMFAAKVNLIPSDNLQVSLHYKTQWLCPAVDKLIHKYSEMPSNCHYSLEQIYSDKVNGNVK